MLALFNRFAHSAGPSCEAGSGDVACGCGGERGGGEMELRMEEYVGRVLPHLRGKGVRMRLKNWLPGVEKGAPGGSNFEPRGVRNGSLEGSGGVPGRLGRQVRLRRAL